MRKLFKKIATVVAAVAMVTAMTTTAFAADTTYNVAGAAGLCGEDWKPDQNQMTDNGDGTWTKEFTNIAAGTYEFKVVEGGAWGNPDYNLEGSANGGGNASVTVETDGSTVVVGFDGEKATVEVKAGAPADTPDTTPDIDAPTTGTTTPVTGDATAVVAMVAVAAVAATMVLVSRRQTVNN